MSNIYILFTKVFIKYFPVKSVSIGDYLRKIYLGKYMKTLPLSRINTVLDAGCGTGDIAKFISKKYPGLSVSGYDLWPNDKWITSQKNLRFKTFDLLKLNEIGLYELCICIDVLNCTDHNQTVLKNIYNSLKKGGYLYLHVPNKKQQRVIFKNFFIKYDSEVRKTYPGKLYTPDNLKSNLKKIGFKDIQIYHTFGYIGEFIWEVEKLLMDYKIFRFMLLPLMVSLLNIDKHIKYKKGNGILFIANKY